MFFMAGVVYPVIEEKISSKNMLIEDNPLLANGTTCDTTRELKKHNMMRLRHDVDNRMNPVSGCIYAKVMDTRYTQEK